jgi:hypothetical protein
MPYAAADLANVDPILVSSLKVLHLVSSREIAGFLPLQRQLIPALRVHEALTCKLTQR